VVTFQDQPTAKWHASVVFIYQTAKFHMTHKL